MVMQDGKVEPSLDDSNDSGGGAGDDALIEDEGSSGGKAKKLILFIVLPLVLLAGAGGGLYMSGALDSLLAPKEKTEEVEEVKEDKAKETVFLEIPEMIVNLSTPDGQPRYLRLSVQIELSSQSDKAAIEKVMPRVIDQFQTYLRELRVSDLRGSAGIYRLQIELLSRVNEAAYPVEVEDVLFQEILIQ